MEILSFPESATPSGLRLPAVDLQHEAWPSDGGGDYGHDRALRPLSMLLVPSDQASFDKVTMGDFFSAGARRRQADFHHARIELHPGEIDKLW